MNDDNISAALMAGERVDEIGFGGLKLIQKPEEFCYGVDAVLLADYCSEHINSITLKKLEISIIDLGTGSGIIPLILSHKIANSKICGVEVQENSLFRARRSARLNGLEDRISFIGADIKDFGEEWGRDLKSKFDVVTSNPPYTAGCGGLKPINIAKHIARHETTADLNEFFRTASALLRPKGEFFLVHRPSRLADVFCSARLYGLEPKDMRMVTPRQGEKPNIVLVHFVKDGNPGLNVSGELAVHSECGGYTAELEEKYK